MLEGTDGGTVPWQPNQIAGRAGGVEVYRAEGIELRTGDRVRWTRNEKGLGLVNSRTAEVAKVKNGRVTFRLEDGRTLELGRNDPHPHHLDHAWASTVHAFQASRRQCGPEHGSGDAAPALATKQTWPAPHRSQRPECSPTDLAFRVRGAAASSPAATGIATPARCG